MLFMPKIFQTGDDGTLDEERETRCMCYSPPAADAIAQFCAQQSSSGRGGFIL